MTNFSQIADDLKRGIDSPELVASYRSFLAGWMYTLHNEYGRVKSEGARWMTANRKDYGSQAETERAWLASERGQRQTELKHTIEGIDAMLDVLTSQHFALQKEYKQS